MDFCNTYPTCAIVIVAKYLVGIPFLGLDATADGQMVE